MPRFREFVPAGVIPAALLPFASDLAIDEAAFRRHLGDLAGVSDITRRGGDRAHRRGAGGGGVHAEEAAQRGVATDCTKRCVLRDALCKRSSG